MTTKEKKQHDIQKEELAVYEKFRLRVSKILGEIQGQINGEAISQAMDKAADELKGAGEYTKEAIATARESLKKDIATTGDYIKPKIDAMSGDAKKHFEHWRDKGGDLWQEFSKEAESLMELSRDKGAAFLRNVATGLGEWSHKFADKLDASLIYKTGEITHGGEFACEKCGAKINLKKTGHIPPCPKCSKTEFRRV